MHMHRAMSSSFGCPVLKRPRCKRKFSPISISNISYCWMNSTCSNSSSISKNSSNSSQKHPNSFMFSTNLLKKVMQLQKTCKRSLAEKTKFDLLLLTNIMHIQENKLVHKRPHSLANAKHAASEFPNTPNVHIHKLYLAHSLCIHMQSPNITKNISFPDVNPPFCSKFPALHK